MKALTQVKHNSLKIINKNAMIYELVEKFNTQSSKYANLTEWPNSKLEDKLLYWWDLLKNELFDQQGLPLIKPMFSFRRMRNSYACYNLSHNSAGHLENIEFNIWIMNKIPFWDVIETIAHENLHQSIKILHQRTENKKLKIKFKQNPGRNNYHSSYFRAMAENLGFPTTKWGRSIGLPKGLLLEFLRNHNIDVNEQLIQNESDVNPFPATSNKPLLTFRCDCNEWFKTRIDSINVICCKCNGKFKRRS